MPLSATSVLTMIGALGILGIPLALIIAYRQGRYPRRVVGVFLDCVGYTPFRASPRVDIHVLVDSLPLGAPCIVSRLAFVNIGSQDIPRAAMREPLTFHAVETYGIVSAELVDQSPSVGARITHADDRSISLDWDMLRKNEMVTLLVVSRAPQGVSMRRDPSASGKATFSKAESTFMDTSTVTHRCENLDRVPLHSSHELTMHGPFWIVVLSLSFATIVAFTGSEVQSENWRLVGLLALLSALIAVMLLVVLRGSLVSWQVTRALNKHRREPPG